jgi:hypothetical protein
MIKEYLIYCYLYYGMDESIISDGKFDKLCKQLLANWDNYQSAYKKYISKNDLEAGTGYTLFYDHKTGQRNYPQEIITEAEDRLVEWRARKVVEYRTVTDDSEELYKTLKDSPGFLAGLFVDFNYFLKPNPEKRKMALEVIERILEERKDGQRTADVEG